MSLTSVLLRDGRNIGGIIPNVVVEEQHSDNLTITDHPVDQGANITDHAYLNPAEVTMRIGWSNQSLALNGVISGIVSGTLLSGGLKTVKDIYDALLKLQASRKPFDLVTGKRAYSNMLIKSISVTTSAATENALIATVQMRQIIIVQTSTATLKKEAQKMPQKTAPLVERGLVRPQLSNRAGELVELFPFLGK